MDTETHRAFGIERNSSFGFAAGSHLIPAVADEFVVAWADLSIRFASDASGISLVKAEGFEPA